MPHQIANFADERMTRQEAAAYLGVSVQFLEVDVRSGRHGVPYVKVGRKVFYRRSALDQWLASCAVNPGAQAEGIPHVAG